MSAVRRVITVLELPAPVSIVCAVLEAAERHFPGARVIAGEPSKLTILISETNEVTVKWPPDDVDPLHRADLE